MAKRAVKGTPAEPAEYRKHPVVKKLDKRTIDRTKNGEAVFKPGLPNTPAEFALLYLDVEIQTIPAGTDPDDVGLYWIKMPYDVGASDGVVTAYILIKRDSGKVHARPISKNELRNVFKVKNI